MTRRAPRPAGRPVVHASTGHGDPDPESNDEAEPTGLAGALCTLRRWPMRRPCRVAWCSAAQLPGVPRVGALVEPETLEFESSFTPVQGVRIPGAAASPPAAAGGDAACRPLPASATAPGFAQAQGVRASAAAAGPRAATAGASTGSSALALASALACPDACWRALRRGWRACLRSRLAVDAGQKRAPWLTSHKQHLCL